VNIRVTDLTETTRRISDAAKAVLADNWLGGSTIPAHGLYPHQWSWDSAFIAIGLRHSSPERAQWELESLLDAQWSDGRIPHIVFNPNTPLEAYFPGPDLWRSSTEGLAVGAPVSVETSGIVQPPVHAWAALQVHLANPELSTKRDFLENLYPKLVAWHQYLLERRDLGGHGLASILHPWESGMDNSPAWDQPLNRVVPLPKGSFIRRDLNHGNSADRPTDADYGRYIKLVIAYRDAGYADSPDLDFVVEDPAFNALLARSELALAEIATILDRPADAAAHRDRSKSVAKALIATLWDEESQFFLCRDVLDGTLISELTCAGAMPLIVEDLPVATELLATLTSDRFELGTVVGLPSYDLTADGFDAGRYWRGPSWFNIGWLLYQGLTVHGHAKQAAHLRTQLIDSASSTNFAEYLNPLTGVGHGATNFSWTAALALDLLEG
jgi:hypothetical protein